MVQQESPRQTRPATTDDIVMLLKEMHALEIRVYDKLDSKLDSLRNLLVALIVGVYVIMIVAGIFLYNTLPRGS